MKITIHGRCGIFFHPYMDLWYIRSYLKKFELYGIVAICIAVTLQYSVDYIMAVPVSENQLLGIIFVLIEKQ